MSKDRKIPSPINQSNQNRLIFRGFTFLFTLFILLLITTLFAIGTGAFSISFKTVLSILLDPLNLSFSVFSYQESAILWGIRLPRVLLAILVGSTLGVSGCLMQGLFRNPLAEPGLVGISAGAALAAATFMVFGSIIFDHISDIYSLFALPLVAFGGAIGCAFIVHRASLVSGRTSISTMLLAGIAFNSIGFAGLGILQYLADDHQLRSLTFWMMGSLGGATWDLLYVGGPLLLIPLILAPSLAHKLNLLQLGEAEAFYLGVNVERVKRITILLVALGVGTAVSLSGMIGFIGLVVPHIIRLGSTPDYRVLIPGSALLGALLLIGADLVARTAVIPAEMPIGIVTTLVGAPFFLGLLMMGRQSIRL
jgi:iron complex transport system permease protein